MMAVNWMLLFISVSYIYCVFKERRVMKKADQKKIQSLDDKRLESGRKNKELFEENEALKADKVSAYKYHMDDVAAWEKDYDEVEKERDNLLENLEKIETQTMPNMEYDLNDRITELEAALKDLIEDVECPGHEAHDWSQQVTVKNAREALKKEAN